MYPKISDFFNDIFGTHICLPIQSFGFFVALAFFTAYWVIQKELKRKQLQGLFDSTPVKVITGGPIPMSEVLSSFGIFALIGYKLGLGFENYDAFCTNPQDAVLSLNGSFLWAFIFGAIAGGLRFYQFQKAKNTTATEEIQQHGIAEDTGNLFMIAFVTGILGAKLFHNLEYWDRFIQDPIGNLLSFDGLTFYGGLICAAAAMIYYINRKGYAVLVACDAITPVIILGYGIGRMGCHISGDGDWGKANPFTKPSFLPDWAWAYHYPHNVLGEGVQIPGCVGQYCGQLAEAVYPTAFYECLMGIAIFFVLWGIRKKLPYVGQITGIYLIFNGFERFMIEFIRVNERYALNLSQAQFIAMGLMVFGVVILYLSSFIWKKDNLSQVNKN
jgi:prolipoprotein diacylglyceryl transferase